MDGRPERERYEAGFGLGHHPQDGRHATAGACRVEEEWDEVRLERDLRFQSACLDRVQDEVPLEEPGSEQEERLLGELLDREAPARRERMRSGYARDDLIPKQGTVDEVFAYTLAGDDPDVHRARRDPVLDRPRPASLDREAKAGVPSSESRDHAGEGIRGEHRRKRHGQLPAQEALPFPHLELESPDAAQDFLRVREERAPVRSERDLPATPVEKGDAQLCLEVPDGGTESWLRHSDRVGGAGEAAPPNDLGEVLQLAEVHRVSIVIGYRSYTIDILARWTASALGSASEARMTEAFKDHFSGVAAGYQSFRPGYPPALFEWLASVAPGRERAVDLGCGTGQASVALAERFDEVIALDPSAEQIAHAVGHPRVTYRVAPAEATGLPDASADLVIAAQAMHWFDPGRLHPELARIARPGAVFAAFTYGLCRVDDAVDAVVDRLYRVTLGSFWPPERAHVDAAYQTLPFPWPELAAPAFAIEESWSLDRFVGYLGTWSAVSAYRRRNGEDPVALAVPALREAWGYRTDRTITWDLAVRAGRLSPAHSSGQGRNA